MVRVCLVVPFVLIGLIKKNEILVQRLLHIYHFIFLKKGTLEVKRKYMYYLIHLQYIFLKHAILRGGDA